MFMASNIGLTTVSGCSRKNQLLLLQLDLRSGHEVPVLGLAWTTKILNHVPIRFDSGPSAEKDPSTKVVADFLLWALLPVQLPTSFRTVR